jgi:hypothetical protein
MTGAAKSVAFLVPAARRTSRAVATHVVVDVSKAALGVNHWELGLK